MIQDASVYINSSSGPIYDLQSNYGPLNQWVSAPATDPPLL